MRSITLLSCFLLAIGCTSLTATRCFAQEAFLNSTVKNTLSGGTWQGKDWKRDGTVLFADARPRIIVTTDMETGEQKIVEEKPSEIRSCVQIDDGECVQSDYFKATIKDVKE